jgi:mRNA interferase MazF
MNQGEIFLVPFPFSDLTGTKVRPVLIVSNKAFNASSQDVVVCAITSHNKENKYSIMLKPEDLIEGTLHTTSTIKCKNLFKIKKGLLIKKIGCVNEKIVGRVIKKIHSLF